MPGELPALTLREVTNRLKNATTTTNRPLLEPRTHEAAADRSIELDLQPCPYPDYRREKNAHINLSALKDLLTEKSPAFQLLSELRYLFVDEKDGLTVDEFYKISIAGEFLSAYQLFQTASDERLQPVIGVLHKICSGFEATGVLLYMSYPGDTKIDADDINRCVAEHQLLYRSHLGCAAPQPLIDKALEFVTHTHAQTLQYLPELIGDVENFRKFTDVMVALKYAEFQIQLNNMKLADLRAQQKKIYWTRRAEKKAIDKLMQPIVSANIQRIGEMVRALEDLNTIFNRSPAEKRALIEEVVAYARQI